MERRELAPGLSISRLVTGLWQVADQERGGRTLDPGAAERAMAPYVEAGLTTFDMADHYGSAEQIVGRFLARRPHAVEALTKWVPAPGPMSRERVRAAVDRARRRLGVEALDLLQLHAWRWAEPGWLDALCHLEALRREGLVRHLGLTNFDAAHLRVVTSSGIRVASNQVCFSLLDRRPLARMTGLCAERGVALLAYGTLAGGFLTERWLGEPEPAAEALATWSQMKYKRFVDAAGGWAALQRLLEALAAVARRRRASMANVACRWVLDQPAVAGVILGARLTEREHVADNLRLFDLELGERDRAELDAAADGLEPLPGDCGDEYRRPPFLTASGDLRHHLDEEPPPPYPVERDADGRLRAASGTPWESLAGYSRALRAGRRIWVSGTTATHGDRLIGGDDPAAQAHFAIDKIEGALVSLGGRLEDVVRTRCFVHRLEDWEAVARAHGERFASIRPANTLVQARLVDDASLVEIEAEAVVPESSPAGRR